jgi:hypothetical protein
MLSALCKYLIRTLLILGVYHQVHSQSLSGTNGLINIPTAETLQDGEIAIGINYINKKFDDYYKGKYDISNYFVSVGFLPFLEVSLSVTRYLNLPYGQALGDRVPSVRVKVFNENEIMPSIVIGAHDFMETGDKGTNKLSNALYLVTSKHFNINPEKYSAGLHLGYGVNWMKSFDHHFVGLFAGVSLEYKKFIRGMIEYDTEKFNCGVEITLFNHIKLLGGLMKFDTFSGGICYKGQLF